MQENRLAARNTSLTRRDDDIEILARIEQTKDAIARNRFEEARDSARKIRGLLQAMSSDSPEAQQHIEHAIAAADQCISMDHGDHEAMLAQVGNVELHFNHAVSHHQKQPPTRGRHAHPPQTHHIIEGGEHEHLIH